MPVSFDLAGRVAVVVGGTTGIGRALALGLADAGADVVATGRRRHLIDEAAAAIESRGRRTIRMATDVGDAASLHALSDACRRDLGQVDIVVAAAGLTRALAIEWASHGVTVNAIAPGVIETDLNRELLEGPRGQEFLARTPMRRFGRVDELVGAAVYLASDAASFVTGQLLVVDGGLLASGVNV